MFNPTTKEIQFKSPNLRILASFTAEPIEPILNFWIRKLPLKLKISFAAYNQIIHELLNSTSKARLNKKGINIIFIRLEDTYRYIPKNRRSGKKIHALLNEYVSCFVEALTISTSATNIPHLIILCPCSPSTLENRSVAKIVKKAEERLKAEVTKIPDIYVLTSKDILSKYPISDVHDTIQENLGHIPYTQQFYTALATIVARFYYFFQIQKPKAIILDCDDTLWEGIVAEDKLKGIRISEGKRKFQKHLIECQKAGMLLCLCSNNAEEDVLEVFSSNSDTQMPLRLENLSAWEINWQDKSTKIKALAEKLSISLDSMVFIDDNPIECERMRSECPEVLTLQMPSTEEETSTFINDLWQFDVGTVTEEDKRRTQMIQENIKRKTDLQTSRSFENFIHSLCLKVIIDDAGEENLSRIAQLTQKTNQFNSTSRKRNELEIKALIKNSAMKVFTVSVRDRYGDYGIVGVLILEEKEDLLVVDSMLLSCRVLGRGVEYEMIKKVGIYAQEKGKEKVLILFYSNSKNKPFQNLIENINKQCIKNEISEGYIYLSKELSDVYFNLKIHQNEEKLLIDRTSLSAHSPSNEIMSKRNTEKFLEKVRTHYRTVQQIIDALPKFKRSTIMSKFKVNVDFVAPSTPLEQDLCDIWTEVLRIEKIGIHDNFFKIGGHSLLATQVISRIRHLYNIDLPLRALFDHPTVHDLSHEIHLLNDNKTLSPIPLITAHQRPDRLPLSFAQQRLWFLDQLLPDAALYNIPLALKLSGPFNLNAFEQAFNTLIDRHESLRTTFPETEGEAQQYILPLLSINIRNSLEDLSSLSPQEQLLCVKTLASQEANTSFDLSSGPLIRVKLLKLSSQEHVFLMTMHHIISDGWSMTLIFKELSVLYNAYLENKNPNLSSLPIQYADFALWQRQWLQGDVLNSQLSYWKQQLSEIPDLLELPTDKPRPKELTYKGALYHYTLSQDIKNQLTLLSQENGTSLFMTLLAIFQVFLYRYTGQKNIVVGSPIANRHYQEIENLIGFFVNTLALKTTFEGDETFLTILNNLKETTLQAYQNQDVPFEQLVDHLNVTRSLNRNPVFQVMFALQNETPDDEKTLTLQNVQTSPVVIGCSIAKFDLSVSAFEYEEGISIDFEYATDLFEESTIKRFACQFEELIKQTLKSPSSSIQTLPLLTSEEKHQLLIDWNDTKADYPDNKTLHQLFEEQVEKTPDNIAVVYEDETLTYQQLNEKANQLAHYLRTLGVGPDILVAIAVEKSLEMIIGLLGILKAGGAYVPLDPDYPQDRLQFMIEDTHASVLITQSHLQERFKASPRHTICLNLDQTSQDLKILQTHQHEAKPNELTFVKLQNWTNLSSQYSSSNPSSLTLPHHLAYTIYTSGSTGKPKGVLIEHITVLNTIQDINFRYFVNQKDKIMLISNKSFDLSVYDIFGLLLVGGSIYVPNKETLKDGASILSFLYKHSITLWNSAPAFISLLTSHYEREPAELNLHLKKLRLILLSGDWIPLLTFKTLQSIIYENKCYFISLGGATEASIWSISYFVESVEDKWKSIPYGKPLANQKFYILDGYMNPVPIGVSGEIYIGGAGLARGYLNRPDLTAEKFIPNPFVRDEDLKEDDKNSKNLRLYRTGDLARYLPDGNIEFIGRIDDQVKIRGFRIELGEIESTLLQHGDVVQAVVIAREDEPGHKHLVAYVVPQKTVLSSLDKGGSFTSSAQEEFSVLQGEIGLALIEEMRTHLNRSLPDYMIPAFFVLIDKIPLTPNGKIDRKTLPSPDLSLRQLRDQYVAPSTPLEQDLCDIWTEVLRIETIGVHDNFFKIGGDSIISIQLVAKARQKGIHFAVKDIFNHPTLAALALVAQSREDILTLKPDQSFVQGSIPLTPIQRWFFEQNLENKHHYNQATLLCIHEQLDAHLLHQTFELLISHHDALRCRYSQSEGVWKQTNLDYEDTSSLLQILDFSDVPDSELSYLIEEQANHIQQGLNIETGPLIKVVLFNCGQGRATRLLIIIHHLVVDGVSWRILLEDLTIIYLALKRGETPPLPSKTHSYQQWGQALLAYAPSEELKQQTSYWKTIEHSLKSLPVDFNHGPNTRANTHTMVSSLTEEETTTLLQKVPKAYRTQINDVLLTALTLTIGNWTQDYSLSLTLEGHGREDIIKDVDLSRTVGWFTSLFPVHLVIENPKDLGESLKTVKEALRQIPNKGVGYGLLKYLTPDNPLSSHSIHPSLSFNYLGQWDNTLPQKENSFEFGKESVGQSVSNKNTFLHLLDINSEIRQGKLQIFWSYSTNHYYKQTMETLSQSFINNLKRLILHCSQENTFGYTPSDFDLVTLSQSALDDGFGDISHIESLYPLSPMQSGLLFQALYAPTSDVYFVQSIFELEGGVNVMALQSAWQEVTNHHPILRTGIVWESLETALQYVLESVQVPFKCCDWKSLNEENQQKKLEEFIQEDRKKGFNLREAPLFRVTLIHCTESKHYLIWSQHHILTDGWSTPIILGDVFKAYESIKQGKKPKLTPCRPYRDYIAWLRQQDMKKAEIFWKNYLASIEVPTRLSFKNSVKKNPEKDYDSYSLTLSFEETNLIKKFAQDHNLTLNTLVQGVVGLVLKTYTGQPEVVMGVTVSGRSVPLPGIEGMVGLFINMLPLKISPQPKETFLSFLSDLQNQTQRLNDYAYTPLAQIQSWTQINQSLFDVLFTFQNYPSKKYLSNLEYCFSIKKIRGIEKTEHFLAIDIIPGEQLCFSLNFQTKHFNKEIIEELVGQMVHLLTSLANKLPHEYP